MSLSLTGTLLGGYASTIFHLLYRFSPEIRTEFGRSDEHRWIQRYGFEEVTVGKPDDAVEDGRNSRLPEGFVVASTVIYSLELNLPSPLQYLFSPAPQDVRRRDVSQGLVIAPVVVLADEGGYSRLQAGGQLMGHLVHVPL